MDHNSLLSPVGLQLPRSERPTRFLPLELVIDRTSARKTSVYQAIKRGLFPPSVPLFGRRVGFFEHEVESVLRAKIRGASDDEIRELVASLVEQRKSL